MAALEAQNAALRQQGTTQAVRLDQQPAGLSTLQEQVARLLGADEQAHKSRAARADGAGPAARFSSPTSVAVDAAGAVYVADQSNHTIRVIR